MKRIKLLICLLMILIPRQVVQAEDLLRISEEGYVSLSLDMIRKGIQRQNVGAVMRVVGPSVLVQGTDLKSQSEFARIIEEVFANSANRTKAEGRRALPSSGTAKGSNLWDFDVLSPQVTINGDSAVVDCELVLWGAIPSDSFQIGSKVVERLVFWSPAKDQPGNTLSIDPLRWRLVECDNLLKFLKDYGETRAQKDNSEGGQR